MSSSGDKKKILLYLAVHPVCCKWNKMEFVNEINITGRPRGTVNVHIYVQLLH